MPLRRAGRIRVTGTSVRISLIGVARAHRTGRRRGAPRMVPAAGGRPWRDDAGVRRASARALEAATRPLEPPPARRSSRPSRRARERPAKSIGEVDVVRVGRRPRLHLVARRAARGERRGARVSTTSEPSREPAREALVVDQERVVEGRAALRARESLDRARTMCSPLASRPSRGVRNLSLELRHAAKREMKDLERKPLADQRSPPLRRRGSLADDDVGAPRCATLTCAWTGWRGRRSVGGAPSSARRGRRRRAEGRSAARAPRTTPNRGGTAARTSWSGPARGHQNSSASLVDHPVGAVLRRGQARHARHPLALAQRLARPRGARDTPPVARVRARGPRSSRRPSDDR